MALLKSNKHKVIDVERRKQRNDKKTFGTPHNKLYNNDLPEEDIEIEDVVNDEDDVFETEIQSGEDTAEQSKSKRIMGFSIKWFIFL